MTKVDGNIGKRFVVVIPKSIRDRVQLKEGEQIKIHTDGIRIIIEPQREDPFEKLERIAGDIRFNRRTRKEAEKYLLDSVKSEEN